MDSTEATPALAAMKDGKYYTNAEDYWKKVPATVQGMLGGFDYLSDIDCSSSIEFISGAIKPKTSTEAPLGTDLALDCGAGIGRVSKYFLLKVFKQVDLVEQNQEFLDVAKESYLGELAQRVERFIGQGLQNFSPDAGRYDLIWMQWCCGHLTDDDFVAFLQRCKAGLKPNGLIGVKENITTIGVDFDSEDS
ncbi:N-terminal Xaa-Pro-Lys N-methyltransferase 1, partial [Quaeritorhiza haematococci]